MELCLSLHRKQIVKSGFLKLACKIVKGNFDHSYIILECSCYLYKTIFDINYPRV
jgi:hypothetical protein